MFFKSLQIQGFKSFPDKIKLNFEQGITATVGPNGSGKSNISDAVRWVLGEQAPNALRVDSMEGVVFSGTDTRKAAGFAEVILTIDNSQHWLAHESDEIAISRRYYRSGASEYRINGKSALLRDINELFMDTGVGRGGYSMIGQGKVSDIVDARPHDRRIIFEEAAGISKYRYRKNEADKNLAKTEENLTHLDVILTGLEERVGPLEKESEKAKKFLELRDERKKAEIGLWLYILGNSTNELRDQGYKITELENRRRELDDTVAELDAEADALYQRSNELSAEKDAHLRSCAELEEQAVRLEGEAAVLDNEVSRDRADIARIENELEQSAQAGSELAELIALQRVQLEGKREESVAALELIDKYRGDIESLRSGETDCSERLNALYAEQNALTVELSGYQLTATRAESQLAEIGARSQTVGEVIADRAARATRLEGEIAETQQALAAAADRIGSLGNTVGGYRMRLDKQRAKAEEARGQADELRLSAADKARRAQTIEDLERSMEGYDHSVRKVIQYAESGGLRGIHGPVSRMINVEREYAVAVETALGGAIKNIIVDTDVDGKQAMEYLKKTRGGRATFLPISVIRPRFLRENGLDNCPGYVDVAAHLVECAPKYRDIIDNLLGTTCVVEDIDSAISIGRRFGNRFKIVTLDGQVISAGGHMTGGSSDRNIGLLSRKGELEALRAEAAQLEEQAKKAAENAAQLKQRAASDEAALLAAQSELTCAAEDKVSFEADLKLLQGQLAQCSAELAAAEAERDGTADRVTSLRGEKAEADRLAGECRTRQESLSEQISLHTGDIDRLSEERERLSSLMGEAGMKQLSLDKEAEALAAQIAEREARMAQGGGRDVELRGQITALESHIAELVDNAAQLRSQAQAKREKSSGSQDVVQGFERRRDELEAGIRERRTRSREASAEREQVSSKKSRLEERLEQTQRDHDALITRMMEEYSLTRREAQEQFEPAEDERAAKRRVGELKNKMNALGDVHVGAIEEFKKVNEDYQLYKTQIADVIKSKGELEKLIADLTAKMQEMFLETFAKINKNFSEIFPELFGGGSATMVLVDAEDCLNCGIDIQITQPSRQKGSNVSMSGGEKSIVAVAIYFAIMKVKPSPFCFLDEIDSALDEHNVVNLANYIKRFTNTTQYIVISHRRGMMEAASMLYGVTKQEGMSKLIELRLDEIEEKLGKID